VGDKLPYINVPQPSDMKTSFSTILKNLMVTWTIFFSILLAFILFQAVVGKFGDYGLYPFLWLLSCTIPYICFVAFRFWQIKNTADEKVPEADRSLGLIVKTLSTLYLVTLLVILLTRPLSKLNPVEHLKRSAPGLYVFQVVLIGACVFLDLRVRKTSSVIDAKPEPLKSDPVVFISYNHNDKAIADEIRTLLEKRNIDVILDSDDMNAGEVINQFIIDSVNRSTITLSILSTNSLMSGYVSMETIRTFYSEEFTHKKKLIACYLDDDFMRADFIIRSVKKIDEKLAEIKKIIDEQDALDVDTKNLNSQKTRLYDLRQNLDRIVEKLNASLCIDIRGDQLTANFPKILESIID